MSEQEKQKERDDALLRDIARVVNSHGLDSKYNTPDRDIAVDVIAYLSGYGARKVGARIKRYREAANLSRDNVLQMTGMSLIRQSYIETGARKLDVEGLAEYSRALQASTDSLLGIPLMNVTLKR